MEQHFLYFAYGSNLLSRRLRARTASAHPIGRAVLRSHALRWHMASADGSGKCDVVALDDDDVAVHGVVYRIDRAEKHLLDRAESLGVGYREERVAVDLDGRQATACVYRALRIDAAAVPYDWYRALVLGGAREHALPAHYQQRLAAVTTRPDPDPQRAAMHFALVHGADVDGPTRLR